MPQAIEDPTRENGRPKRVDNYRIFRAQAVEAYSTRQAGEPWCARLRFEGWIIAGLTAIAFAAALIISMRGH